MKRRAFLKTVAGAAGVVGRTIHSPRAADAVEVEDRVAGMPRRSLPRTGDKVSVVGYPGFALRENHDDPNVYAASIRKALESGVNYFDVAPSYAETKCEARMGAAFASIGEFDRDAVFLANKTKERGRRGARRELEDSLKRLNTDYFDLYQLHCLIDPEEDVKPVFGPRGAMEAMQRAKKEGKIRLIGFSAHTTRAALAAMNQFRFDSVMFPINFVELFRFGYGKSVMELAHQQGTAVFAIKAMSAGAWPPELSGRHRHKRQRQWWYQTLEQQEQIDLAMRFTLSQKAVVAALPPAWLDLAEKGVCAGKNYRVADEEDVAKLRTMAEQAPAVFQKVDEVAHRGAWDKYRPCGPHEGCESAIA